MKHSLMEQAWKYCEDTDRSMEFTMQYIQDFAEVNFDTMLKFVLSKSENSPAPDKGKD